MDTHSFSQCTFLCFSRWLLRSGVRRFLCFRRIGEVGVAHSFRDYGSIFIRRGTPYQIDGPLGIAGRAVVVGMHVRVEPNLELFAREAHRILSCLHTQSLLRAHGEGIFWFVYFQLDKRIPVHKVHPERMGDLQSTIVVRRPVRESHFSGLTRQAGWRMFHGFQGGMPRPPPAQMTSHPVQICALLVVIFCSCVSRTGLCGIRYSPAAD